MHYLVTEEFLNIIKTTPLVDVRSPKEYDVGHLSGSLNIPLFNDEEREEVGTIYKQIGRNLAIAKGLEFVGPKLSVLAKKAEAVAADGKIALYCWRGGMRSEKMAWLFELIGLSVYILKGGYKSYRNYLLKDFDNIEKLIVLQGPTGSGKTAILNEMKSNGEQVIDLEALANHKGSAFGNLGLGPQPTTQQFQNDLHKVSSKLDRRKRIWIESESLSVGKVYLPESLWKKMNVSSIFELNMDRRIRAHRLVNDYGQFRHEDLRTSILKISSRFGGNRVKQTMEYLDKNNLLEVAMLLLEYYDKSYEFSRSKYKMPSIASINTSTGDPKVNMKLLLAKADELNL